MALRLSDSVGRTSKPATRGSSMNAGKVWMAALCGLIFFLHAFPMRAQQAASSPAGRDGQHDFDFELGSWKIHLKRLDKPLSGSTKWFEFDGTSVTRKLWNGRAQIEQF